MKASLAEILSPAAARWALQWSAGTLSISVPRPIRIESSLSSSGPHKYVPSSMVALLSKNDRPPTDLAGGPLVESARCQNNKNRLPALCKEAVTDKLTIHHPVA